jgi:hypothetical protein
MPRKLRFDALQFMSAWSATHASRGTIHDLAASLGIDHKCASNRAFRLRSRGIRLPILRKRAGKPRQEVRLHQPVSAVVHSEGLHFTITTSGEGHA